MYSNDLITIHMYEWLAKNLKLHELTDFLPIIIGYAPLLEITEVAKFIFPETTD
jgi:hypothetical protein